MHSEQHEDSPNPAPTSERQKKQRLGMWQNLGANASQALARPTPVENDSGTPMDSPAQVPSRPGGELVAQPVHNEQREVSPTPDPTPAPTAERSKKQRLGMWQNFGANASQALARPTPVEHDAAPASSPTQVPLRPEAEVVAQPSEVLTAAPVHNEQPEDSQNPAPASQRPKKQRLGMWQNLGANASEVLARPMPAERSAATPTSSPAPVDLQPSEELTAAPVQSTSAAPALRQRMGHDRASTAAPVAGVAAEQIATSTDAGTMNAAPTRQRMGGAAPALAVQPVAAPQETVAPSAPFGTSSRMGSAGQKGASVTDSGTAAPQPVAQNSSQPKQAASTPASAKSTKKRPAWVRPVMIGAGILVLALVMVLAARWLRTLEPVQQFLATFDGHATQPESAPTGLPAWMGWQHFLNIFFLVLIMRTGLQVRMEKRAPGYWKPKENSFFSPKGNVPKKVSLSQWLHQSLDILWIANGVIFIVLLAVTGHWMRIVPTNWDVFPNMASAALQYVSLDWPTENGWVHYNALQMVSYFLIVYVAAPVAILSGWRMSTWWPAKAATLNRVFPLEIARGLHFPTMLFFVGFTIVHVFLVFFTGALRNLNHMYTSRDVVDWWGLVIFLGSVLVIVAGWYLTKPMFTTPLATRMGSVTKN